jgi:hypothetical protein
MSIEEQPQSKGIEPVPNVTLINFLYWLRTYHYPALQHLHDLPVDKLLELIHTFENHRPDVEAYVERSWAKSIDYLFTADPDYKEARDTFYKLK